MTSTTTKPDCLQPGAETSVYLFDNWFDPIEAGLRDRVREFIHAMFEGELDTALSRPRYARHAKPPSGEAEGAVCATGHRHGHRSRSLLGSFGQVEIEVPRARLNTADGKTTEWKSKALRAYQRRTLVADALIAGAYLAGTNTAPGACQVRECKEVSRLDSGLVAVEGSCGVTFGTFSVLLQFSHSDERV